MKSYLHKRPNSDNWQIRLPVPTDLHDILGKREITKSTKTTDRKIAEDFSRQFVFEKRQMFEEIQSESVLAVPFDLNTKIVEVFFIDFCDKQRSRRSQNSKDHVLYQRWIDGRRAELQTFIRLANIPDYSRIEETVGNFLKRRGFPEPSSDDERQQLLEKCMRALIDGLDVVLREAEGEANAHPKSDFVNDELEQSKGTARKGEQISDYMAKYLDHLEREVGRGASAIQQDETVIRLFIEWAGDHRLVDDFSRKDAAAFRDALDKFPINRRKVKRLLNASIAECIDIAQREGRPTLSPTTKNRYISQLSAFFGWMRKRGYCDQNIWQGMSFTVDKKANQRQAFTTDELNIILSSPLFTGFQRDKLEHIEGDCTANDWRYWIPLICLFTGARVTEVAQLHVDEIEEIDNHLVGYLRAEADRGQSLKSSASLRLVVFHPTLIKAGLREYWMRQASRSKRDGNAQLFPELAAGKRPELGAKPSRWWRRYLEKIGVKKGADSLGTHSFRHRMADEMRSAGYTNQEFGHLIMGHADGSVTARYGQVPQGTVQRLSDMISKAEFKGVDFSKIMPKSKAEKSSKIPTFEESKNPHE